MAPVSGSFHTPLSVVCLVSFHSAPRLLWSLQCEGVRCPPQSAGECWIGLGGLTLVTFATTPPVCFMYSAAELHLCHLFLGCYLCPADITKNNHFFFLTGVCACVSCSVMSDSLQLRRRSLARILCPWNSPGRNTGVDFPNPGIEAGSPVLQAESLPSEPPRKPLLGYSWFVI